MNRRYIAVRFRPGDRRTYTYHWDGEILVAGDRVKVPDRSGDGWNAVEVASVSFDKPHFDTKAILGHADPVANEVPIVPADEGRTNERQGDLL